MGLDNTSKELIMVVKYGSEHCKDEKLGKYHANLVRVEILLDLRNKKV